MTRKEVTAEIMRDYLRIRGATTERLATEYDRERRKLKIDKTRTYTKVCPIRTAAKNNWIVFLSKSPTDDKYKGPESIRFCNVVYYHTKQGLWVFKPIPTGGLAVYTGHFFQRYNERLGLNLSRPMDVVKRFFTHSGRSEHTVVEKEGKNYSIGVCREGLLLGKMEFDTLWLLNKTFISRDLTRTDQKEFENEMLTSLQREVERALTGCSAFPNLTKYKAEIAKGITDYNVH